MKQKTACLGLFSAVAIILGYVESLIPFYFGIPGVKLGLTNIVVVLMLYCVGTKEALAVSALRIVLSGFLFGNLFSILYSLAGAALSMTVMTLMLKNTSFSLIGVSVAGGVSHNIGQLIIAMLIVQNASVFVYAPALLVAGVAAGVVIGGLTNEILKRVHL